MHSIFTLLEKYTEKNIHKEIKQTFSDISEILGLQDLSKDEEHLPECGYST